VFNSDPVNALLHLLSLDKQKNGLEITQKVYDHYFVNNKETDDIVTQYGQVYEVNFKADQIYMFSKSDFILILKLLSEIGFFKCVDDSVKWLSQYSDQPVYYYQYAHHGQNSLTKLLNVPQDADFGEWKSK
jgi:hypothetical protein